MATVTHKKAFNKAFADIVAEQQATATVSPAMAADLERRRSGAAGAHAKSGIHRSAAAGRKTRVGNRNSQRRAHIRDGW